jgi:hypothetical protein
VGSIFTEDGKIDRDIETRIQKANNISYLLAPIFKHPEISIPTKRQIQKYFFFQPCAMKFKHGH